MLLRASTEATWITAPEVSGKAVNINDSYHPPPGLLQPNSLHFSSSLRFKGKKSCSEQGQSVAGKKERVFFGVGGGNHTQLYVLQDLGFKSIDLISSDQRL